ncbi:MAG: RND family transporter [Bacteroidales bacterium]|nr:RND family transporter [Bacteroidales bacterium]MBN2819857.1 RND family transporter [Bacteroidales bacterium]
MEKLAERIVKFRWVIIAFVLGLTLFLGYQLKNLHINADILSSLPENDPTALLYKNIGKQYGGNNIGMIVLETENVYETEVLKHIKQITDSLSIDSDVSSVTSMTNILDIKSSEWGIEIGKLIDEYNLPEGQAELDNLRNYIDSKDMYKESIVSADGTASLILFKLLHDADMRLAALRIKNRVNNLALPETLYFGGLPFLLTDITELIVSDMSVLIPVVFLIIALILLVSFRSLRGMFLPLLIAGITVIWTLGFMAILKFEISIISNTMPVALLAIGSAYTIHVLNSINLFSLKDRKKALLKALAYTIVPIILASLTTSIGFISFIFGAYLSIIRDFGIITSIGIVFALLLSIFFVPALLSGLSFYNKKDKKANKEKKDIITHGFLQPLIKILFKYPKRVLAIWLIIIAFSIVGVFMIKTSVNITEYFKADNPTRISENIMQKKFGGSLPVFVEFEGDIQEPEVLKMMIKTEEFIKQDPNIHSAQSVADLVEQMNYAMGEGEKIPDDKTKIEQLWFLLDGQDIMEQLVSYNLDKGIIQSKFASIETDEIDNFTNKMNKFIEENPGENYKINFTGIPPLYVKLNDSLVKSQYSSLIIAIILVFLIVAIIMRSLSEGVFATIPIIATVLFLLGFMGFTGIPLDIATVLVGSVAMGIGIDYSIHLITGYNTHMKEFGDTEKAIKETIMAKGNAIIINVLSVAAGFLVLVLSHIVPLKNFGLLIAISMVSSGLGALTLLPVILILAYRKKNNNKTV